MRRYEDKVIELEYCLTKGMVADVLTKALVRERYVMLTKAMGLVGFECLI